MNCSRTEHEDEYEYIANFYRHADKDARHYRLHQDGGDIVFDPFCGCGTAVYAAHLLNRKWIGCDIAILSIRLVRDILLKLYGLEEGKDYIVAGIPKSVEAAHELFEHDPRQFQHWAVELAGGFASAKFSGDRGIDGRIHFETNEGLKNMALSIKGGNKPTPVWMRELGGVIQREEDTEMGGLICLEIPTKGIREEEARGGIYSYQGRDYHRLQIRTIQDLLEGKWFDTPFDGENTWGKLSNHHASVDFWNSHPTFDTEGTYDTKPLLREGGQGDRLLNDLF